MLLPDGSPRLGELAVQAVHSQWRKQRQPLKRVIGQVKAARKGSKYLPPIQGRQNAERTNKVAARNADTSEVQREEGGRVALQNQSRRQIHPRKGWGARTMWK